MEHSSETAENPRPRRTDPPVAAEIPIPFYLLPLLLFIVIPATVARENGIQISRIPPLADLKLLGLAAFVFLALVVPYRFLVRTRAGVVFRHAVEFVCYFVVVAGFFFPVVISTGMVEATETEVNVTHLVVVLSLATVMSLIFHAKGREILHFMLLVFVVLNIGVIAVGELNRSNGTADATNASRSKSVFVLSFDGISGSAVREVLAEDSDFEGDFDGFVLYQEVASSSPATTASLAAELLGNQNFKNMYDTADEIWASSAEQLLTNVLATNGYEVSTYGGYSRNSNSQIHQLRVSTLSGTTVSNLLKLSLARSLTGVFVPRGRLATAIEDLLRVPTQSENAFEADLVSKISASQSPEWSKDLGMSIIDFYRYVSELAVDDGPPTAHFLHFTHTHFPVELDTKCDFRGDDSEWYELNQNWQGVKAETRCALSQFGVFLDKLRALGIYDQSTIVLKSDHGKPVEYGDRESRESLAINDHELWGYGRYAPFLAVKPSFSEIPGLARDSAPVLLDDLARTLCLESGIDYDCNEYPGYNVVRESSEIPSDAKATIFVVESSNSDFRFRTHVPTTVTRGEGILDSLFYVLTQSDNKGE